MKLAIGRVPDRVGPISKKKTSHFLSTKLTRAPLSPILGAIGPGMGFLGLEIDPCRPDMGPAKHVKLFIVMEF